jgi:hypothetical protein
VQFSYNNSALVGKKEQSWVKKRRWHSLKVAALEQQVVRIVSWIVSSFKKSLMMTTEKTATAGIPSPCLKNEEKK